VCGGRRSTLARVAVVSAAEGLFGAWMMKGGIVPLLRPRWMKLTVLGSGDHREDPRPTCHKVSVRFIGSESILISEGALPNLDMVAIRLLFWRFLCGGGGRW
jgi:hypothetical protein